jgi:hypothetical protein
LPNGEDKLDLRTRFGLKFTIGFFFACFFLPSKIYAWDWSREAVRLTGESSVVRERAIRRIKKVPHLKEILRREIYGSRRAQALDVISTLELYDLLPDLVQLGADDKTGAIYSAINSLLNKNNMPAVLAVYRKRLLCEPGCQASGAAQVVILDTLARTGENLSVGEMDRLFKSSQYEIKSAALEYVRMNILMRKKLEFLPFIGVALHSQPWQLRLQSLYLISELPTQIKVKLNVSREDCIQDQNSEVRNSCLHFLEAKK